MALRARRADVEIRAQTRKYKRDLARAKKETKGFAKSAKKSLMAGFSGGFGAVAALGTAGGLADIGSDVLAFEEGLTRLGIQAKGKANIPAIREEVGALSLEFGLGKNAILDAANALTNRLGGEAATTEKVRALTEAHVASGAAMEDLALLALKLDKAFGLETADEMRAGLSALIQVGKDGSVPLAEMATVIAQTGSQFARFGKTGKEAAAELGALIQVAVAGGEAGGFGTAAEAGTGLRAFISQLESSEDKLKALGVTVRTVGKDGQKRFLPMADILESIRKKNLVNRRGFTKLFGSVQARDFLAVLLEQEGAVRSLTQAGIESNASQEDAQAVMAGVAGRSRVAMVKLKNEIAKVFTPERVEAMVKGAEALGAALGFVIDHWELFLGAFVAVKALKIGASLFKWASAARSLGQAGGAAASGVGAVGKAGKAAKFAGMASKVMNVAGALAAAAAAGYAAGRALDNWLDLSGKASDAAISVSKGFKGSAVARAEEQIATLGAAKKRKAAERSAFGRELSPEELSERRRVSLELSRKMSEERAAAKAKATAPGGSLAGLTAQGGAPAAPGATAPGTAAPVSDPLLVAAIEKLAGRPVEVVVDGNVVAQANQRASANRRSPAP